MVYIQIIPNTATVVAVNGTKTSRVKNNVSSNKKYDTINSAEHDESKIDVTWDNIDQGKY